MTPPLSLDTRQRWANAASWVLSVVALVGILWLHLLSALLAGLVVHQLTTHLAQRLPQWFSGLSHSRARVVVVGALAVIIIALLVSAGWGISAFLRQDASNWSAVLGRVDEALIGVRAHLPAFLANDVPTSIEGLQTTLAQTAHTHAETLQNASKATLTHLAHILIGLILGAMIALSELRRHEDERPLARALKDRAGHLAEVFGQIVSAQLKITAVNTTLTALFLWVVLPLLGAPLPLSKTLVLLTFLIGFLPVVGNLISNTLIVLVAFSVAPWVAAVALVFLIVIHKLEYFLNARIVGGEINAKAWELLLAMLVMEAMFGLAGVVAAPIFYAWLKRELRETQWV
jgi:predicted PurR-regulated permease PerM